MKERAFAMAWLLIFGLTALPALAQNEDENGDEPERERANLRQVVSELSTEANEQLREDRTYPREESSYADDENLEMERGQVIQALSRRLDREPFIDAYIKWQLLSFLPELDDFSNNEYRQIMRGFPEFMPRPDLTQRQWQLFDYAADSPDPSLSEDLEEANEQFKNNIAEMQAVNMPARAYRDAIIDNMPLENGVRWLVRLEDIEARFLAGDTTYEDLFNQLRSETGANTQNRDIPVQARYRFLDEVERVAELRNDMVEYVTIFANGDVNVREIGAPFSGRDVERLEDNLLPSDERDD